MTTITLLSSLPPQLLAPGELAPGIQASEFAARRASLAARMPLGSCALVPATAVAYMTGVIPYPYRQDADFLYLTGITQPGAVALITAGQGDMVLFVTDPDETRERWDGARCSAAAATDVFGAVAAYPMSEVLPASGVCLSVWSFVCRGRFFPARMGIAVVARWVVQGPLRLVTWPPPASRPPDGPHAPQHQPPRTASSI